MFIDFLFSSSFYFWIAFLFCFFILISIFLSRSFFQKNKKSFLAIFILKILFFVLLFFIFLQPYFLVKKPAENSSIAILTDISKSMEINDCLKNKTRLETIHSLIGLNEEKINSSFYKLANYLKNNFSLQNYNFVNSLIPSFSFLSKNSLTSKEGTTDIANALLEAESKKINSIFLFSDGISFQKERISQVIKKLKQKEITVHTVGIGEKKRLDDLQISFHRPPKNVTKNSQFDLQIQVKNFFPYSITTEIELFENEYFLEKKKITIKPFTTNFYSFQQVAFNQIKKFYKIKIPLQKNEILTYNNIDYTTVKIKGNQKYNFFYYSEALSSEYKYFNQMIEQEKNLKLTSVIALNGKGEKKYFTKQGVKNQKEIEKIFSTKNLMNQQIIFLGKIKKNSAIFNDKSKIYKNIKNTFSQKGNGLFIYGQNFDNQILQKMIFKKEIKRKKIFLSEQNNAKQSLNFVKKSIFLQKQKDFFLQNEIVLPSQENLFLFSQNKDSKENTKTVINQKDSLKEIWNYDLLFKNQAGLIYGLIGINKVAILEIPTWQWFVENRNFYNQFWYAIFDYLLSANPKKITLLNHHKKYSNEEINLTVDVLNEKFLGDKNAQVKMTLTYPKNKKDKKKDKKNFQETFFLKASPTIAGRYQKIFLPAVKGEYLVELTVLTDEKKEKKIFSSFLVYNAQRETEYFPLNEKLLKKIALETGGTYHHYKDAFDIEKDLKIKTAASWQEEKKEFFDKWYWMVILIVTLSLSWFLGRRIGMK